MNYLIYIFIYLIYIFNIEVNQGYLVAGVGVCDVGACLLAVRDACVVDIIVPVVAEPRGKVGRAVVGSVGGLSTINSLPTIKL